MGRSYRSIRRPTARDLREAAATYGMTLTDDEVECLASFVESTFEDYDRIDELCQSAEHTRYTDRRVLDSPSPDQDPLNAIITRCEVPGSDDGPLSGYDVGLKDNIAVAGVEMTCGSRLLSGYVPQQDATVVERLLDAGATITAKLNMEDLSYSGSGELSSYGAVRNPRNSDYLAGGSSSGSAAAVADGLVDIALGADQGGSIRMPAAWSGVVGLKPTHGLVPYTGVMPLEPTIDYVGPITRTVADCARALTAIAGPDGLDHRQRSMDPDDYLNALNQDPETLTVGIISEGFGLNESEQEVDDKVRDAIANLAAAGVTIEEISVPMHLDGSAILTAIYMEGTAALVADEGIGRYYRGAYDDQFAIAFGQARRANADDFPPMLKLTLLIGRYMAEEYQGRFYARSQNLLHDLSAAYDEALSEVDVLALPTTPHTAHRIETEPSLQTLMNRSLTMTDNTAPFNGSGHPAISVPCGTVEDGLPVGLMLVGPQHGEKSLLRAAQIVESIRGTGRELCRGSGATPDRDQ